MHIIIIINIIIIITVNIIIITAYIYMGRIMQKGPGRHILSIFSLKRFCPLHSPNNMMEVIKVQKQQLKP